MAGWGQFQKGGASANAWQDALSPAVTEAVAGVLQLETEWDSTKLEKKLREYFNKAAKTLQFHNRSKPLQVLIEEYADNAFSSIFNGLGDREWLTTGQADFLLCVDAGIKDNFPPQLLANVSQVEFEQLVLAAHDRAFEEQRVYPIIWEAVQQTVTGPKIRKRLYAAVDEGRKDAVRGDGQSHSEDRLEDYASRWIDRTIARLSEAAEGDPSWILPIETAPGFFHQIFESGGVPLACIQEVGPPPPQWPLVGAVVHAAYAMYATADGEQQGGFANGSMSAPVPKGQNKGHGGHAKGNCKGYGMEGGYGAAAPQGQYWGMEGAFGGAMPKGAGWNMEGGFGAGPPKGKGWGMDGAAPAKKQKGAWKGYTPY